MPSLRLSRVDPRTGLIGRVGRSGRQGLGTELLGAAANPQRLSHRARRRIAAPPMSLVERVVAAVGSALAAWSARFIDRVMASAPLPVKADASVRLDALVRLDASVDELFAALDDPKVARELLERTFASIDARSSDDLRVIGVQTSTVVPDAQRLQQAWISKSTDLIRATEDVKRRVKAIIEGPLVEGRTAADIRKLLEEQAGYSRSRAELTARDQTLKLYGKIQEERQTAAGFTKYVWTTSLDERVREDHAALDGTVQSWDDPPIVDQRTGRRGHPGADFQCRCSAVPFADDQEVIAQPDTEVQRALPPARDIQAEAEAAAQARRSEAAFAPPTTLPASPTIAPSIEPLTASQLVDRAELAPIQAAKRAQVERAVDSALVGKSLQDLGAIPFDAAQLATDKSLEFLRTSPHFLTTGNVADRYGASRGGLPQITIGADGKAYLSNGRHRLTVARERGLRQIIARVVHVGPRGGVRWEYVGPIRV